MPVNDLLNPERIDVTRLALVYISVTPLFQQRTLQIDSQTQTHQQSHLPAVAIPQNDVMKVSKLRVVARIGVND